LFRDVFYLRSDTERVEWSVTSSTEHEEVFVGCFAANFARLAVETLPVRLEHICVVARKLQTVGVEALCAKSAGNEVRLVSERPAEVAHFFEDKARIVKRTLYSV
jgi:hypothetical protein